MEQPALLERADELGLLHGSAAEVAASGRGGVVVVFGEAGIGKTAVLRQFREELSRRITVLWGSCDALFTPRPLGPLVGLANDLGGEPKALVARGARPFDVAVAFLEALHVIAPTAVIVEDLHWADEATLDVVRVLARRAKRSDRCSCSLTAATSSTGIIRCGSCWVTCRAAAPSTGWSSRRSRVGGRARCAVHA